VQSGEEVAGGLFVAGRDASELLEIIEEALDEIAFGVKREIAVAFDLAVRLGRDDRADFARLYALDEAIGVVTLVAEHGFGFDLGGQRLGLRDVVGLAAGQGERQRIAERVDDRVDFRRQAAARTAYGLVQAPFLRAPALC